METFSYIAFNQSSGQREKGLMTAENSYQARQLLRERGLLPGEVKVSASNKVKTSRLQRLFRPSIKIKLLDLSMCLRQLSTLLTSGLPLEDSLKLMAEQSDNEQLKHLVTSWRSDLREGRSLSQSMRYSRYQVPENLIATVAVGEETGHLSQVLERMAGEMEIALENRQAVRQAMVYPMVVLFVAAVVLYILLSVAVPKVVVVFESSRQALPLLTLIVIASSEFVQNYGLYVVATLVALIVLIRYRLRDKRRKLRLHNLLIHRPLLGRWALLSDISDWSRGMGLLLSSGVPILIALKVANASVQNLWLRKQLDTVSEKVRQGSSLYQSVKGVDVMPSFLLHMVSSGEASSELDIMLLRVGEYYSNRLKNSIDSAIKLIQPLIILLLGGLVALIISAIFMPIMNMTSAIR